MFIISKLIHIKSKQAGHPWAPPAFIEGLGARGEGGGQNCGGGGHENQFCWCIQTAYSMQYLKKKKTSCMVTITACRCLCEHHI